MIGIYKSKYFVLSVSKVYPDTNVILFKQLICDT